MQPKTTASSADSSAGHIILSALQREEDALSPAQTWSEADDASLQGQGGPKSPTTLTASLLQQKKAADRTRQGFKTSAPGEAGPSPEGHKRGIQQVDYSS
jgi:hypothetical protein